MSSKFVGRILSYAQLKLDNQISNFPTRESALAAQ